MVLKPRYRATSLTVLVVMVLLVPLSVFLMIFSIVSSRFARINELKSLSPKTVLITGGKMSKALQLARLLHKSGHKIILAETKKYWASGHAYSKAVSSYKLLPEQSHGYREYSDTIAKIVEDESVDCIIPVASPTAVYFDAKLKNDISPSCEIFHFKDTELSMLDDKFSLCRAAKKIGLTAPDVYKISHLKDFEKIKINGKDARYILKSVAYDPIERLRRPILPFSGQDSYLKSLNISSERPWVLQEFIPGQEFCTHSTVREGKILLHCCCASSDFQLRYHHVEHPAILDWVEKFVSRYNLTGQISFDFIVKNNGDVMPIECNPRTHSAITCFYNSDFVSRTYLEPDMLPDNYVCQPEKNARETYWFYYELWKLFKVRSFNALLQQIKLFVFGKEAVLDGKDPLPFLMLNHWQIPCLLIKAAWFNKPWVRIDFNIGKLVELGGD